MFTLIFWLIAKAVQRKEDSKTKFQQSNGIYYISVPDENGKLPLSTTRKLLLLGLILDFALLFSIALWATGGAAGVPVALGFSSKIVGLLSSISAISNSAIISFGTHLGLAIGCGVLAAAAFIATILIPTIKRKNQPSEPYARNVGSHGVGFSGQDSGSQKSPDNNLNSSRSCCFGLLASLRTSELSLPAQSAEVVAQDSAAQSYHR